MDKKDIFSFGQCGGCGKYKALKNGYCEACNKVQDLFKWFKF